MGRSFPQVEAAVRQVIAEERLTPAFSDLLLHLMARPGRVLATPPCAKWPAFVLKTCAVLGGDMDAAVWGATAVEFSIAAADVVDDVVDDDWNEQGITPARAINASSALIWLVQRSLRHLAECLDIDHAQRIGNLITHGYLAASEGEDLDLLLEALPVGDEELACQMTQRKSGSLVAMACEVGAALATDDPALERAAGNFGGHVGMVAQLLNDLTGLDSTSSCRGSDLRRKKKTLPVAYALRCAAAEGNTLILDWYRAPHVPNAEEEQAVVAALGEMGALHYGWVLAHTYRQQAFHALRTLAQVSGCGEVYRLRRLVPSVSGRPAPRGTS